jgi:hypothetical protein
MGQLKISAGKKIEKPQKSPSIPILEREEGQRGFLLLCLQQINTLIARH